MGSDNKYINIGNRMKIAGILLIIMIIVLFTVAPIFLNSRITYLANKNDNTIVLVNQINKIFLLSDDIIAYLMKGQSDAKVMAKKNEIENIIKSLNENSTKVNSLLQKFYKDFSSQIEDIQTTNIVARDVKIKKLKSFLDVARTDIYNTLYYEVDLQRTNNKQIASNIKNNVILIAICCFISLILLIALIIHTLKGVYFSIHNMINVFHKIGKEKDFTVQIPEIRVKELSVVKEIIEYLMKEVRELIGIMQVSSINLSSFVEQLAVSTEEVASSMEEITASSSDVSKKMNILRKGIDGISVSMQKMDTVVMKLSDFLENIDTIVQQFVDTMGKEQNSLKKGNEYIAESSENMVLLINNIDEFRNTIEHIQKVTGSIQEIHHRIEILSLNAAIEASRAGKDGGGFAVIAREIRDLSHKSANASQNIVSSIDNVLLKFEEFGEISLKAKESFDYTKDEWDNLSAITEKIFKGSKDIISLSEEIKHSLKEFENISSGMDKLVNEFKGDSETVITSMEMVASASEEVAAQMEELASSTQELVDEAKIMKEKTQGVKVKEEEK